MNIAALRPTIHDLVSDFMYYDRKEDEDVSMDALEEAFISGEITVDQVTEAFREEMNKRMEPLGVTVKP